MCKTTTSWTLGAGVIGLWIAISSAPAAQDLDWLTLFNAPGSATVVGSGNATVGGPDSPLVIRVANRPLITDAGVVVATANVTGVIADPVAQYFATVAEIRNDSHHFVLTRLASRDGSTSRSFGFERVGNRPTSFLDGGFIIQDDGSVVYRFKVSELTWTADDTVDNIYRYTQSPTLRRVGDTTYQIRNFTEWLRVTGPSQATVAGTNFNWTAASAGQSVIVNYHAQPGGQHGYLSTCIIDGPTCGVVGVGANADQCGYSEPRTPGSSGNVADSASAIVRTCRHSNYDLPPLACPPNHAPSTAPVNLVAVWDTFSTFSFSFDSVPCAERYAIELLDATGRRIESYSRPQTSGSIQINVTLPATGQLRVAAVNDAGQGPYSRIEGIIRIPGR